MKPRRFALAGGLCLVPVALGLLAGVSLLGRATAEPLRSEGFIRDAIQGRRTLTPAERDFVDINRDGKLDVADLVAYLQDAKIPIALFDDISSTVTEGEGSASIALTFTKEFQGTIHFRIQGTATSGADFSVTGNSVAVNGTTAQIPLTILDDLDIEGVEMVEFMIEKSDDYIVSLNAMHTVYVSDNDGIWEGALEVQGGLYSIALELYQQNGAIVDGKILAPGSTIFEGTPNEREIPDSTLPIDPNGVELDFSGTTAAVFNAETNDITFDLTFGSTAIPFVRRIEFAADPNRTLSPGEDPDVYDLSGKIQGTMKDITEPPSGAQSLQHLARVNDGRFVLIRVPSVPYRQTTLTAASK